MRSIKKRNSIKILTFVSFAFLFLAFISSAKNLILDIEKQDNVFAYIEKGDFSNLTIEGYPTLEILQKKYSMLEKGDGNEFVRCDINEDNVDELLWVRDSDLKIETKEIIAVFASHNDVTKCVFWDSSDRTEFLLLSDNGNVICYFQNFGSYLYVEYNKVRFTSDWRMRFDYRLEVWDIYDLDGLNEKWSIWHPDMIAEGRYYRKTSFSYDIISGEKACENIMAIEEFQDEFYELTGSEWDAEMTLDH